MGTRSNNMHVRGSLSTEAKKSPAKNCAQFIEPEQNLLPCLRELPEQLRFMVSASMSNDEQSSDDEMVAHWISEGLSQEAAVTAIAYRDKFLTDPLFELFVIYRC